MLSKIGEEPIVLTFAMKLISKQYGLFLSLGGNHFLEAENDHNYLGNRDLYKGHPRDIKRMT